MRVDYVNVYLVDRRLGGPEEGGWYYDTGEAIKSIPTLPDRAERLVERVRQWCAKRNELDNRYEPGSVLCFGHYQAWIEDEPARDFPEYHPAYE